MQPNPPRPAWTVPLLIALGATALVIALAVGGVLTVLNLRGEVVAAPSATPSSGVSPSAAQPSIAPPSLSPADCVIGRWRETSYTANAEIFGATVQLRGSGARADFGADGRYTVTYRNVNYRGTAGGDRYEVIHNGRLTLAYETDGETIFYSDPRASGKTTWKVNGRVEATATFRATLDPERFTCKGNKLRLYGDGSASVLERILGPGTDV